MPKMIHNWRRGSFLPAAPGNGVSDLDALRLNISMDGQWCV